LGA
jgi:hypothetical protein